MTKFKILHREIKSLKKEVKKSSLFRKRIYTITEAAEVAGVSISYIQKLVSSNQLSYSKPTGKLIFIRRRDLEKFLMKNYIPNQERVDEIISNKLITLKK